MTFKRVAITAGAAILVTAAVVGGLIWWASGAEPR
jgi:hypothetical protein